MTQTVRVRFAPSPTGHLHIGGARTAIYNWAYARHHGGSFVLRIDDTDRERSTPENTEAILRAMRWLGLDWDEGPEAGGEFGPYFQTERAPGYADALERLKSNGHTYPCFCTPEELQEKRVAAREEGGFSGYDRTCLTIASEDAAARVAAGESHVWRVKVPDDRADITIHDAIRGEVSWPIDAMDDFILVRTDGTATYNFATVVDDWTMEMTHIIRGEDHLSNTPRQIVVYEALEAPVPTFAHMSLIFGADGKRLSKRHGATSVESYRDEGFLHEALLNYLALLGWSTEDGTEVFDGETLIKKFDLSRLAKSPVVWDSEKLEWMNSVYIREMTDEELAEQMTPLLIDADLLTPEQAEEKRTWLIELAPLVSERIKLMPEVVPIVRFFFADGVEVDEKAQSKVLDKDGALEALEAAHEALSSLDPFDTEPIEEALRKVPESTGLKPKLVFQSVRVAVTGSMVSPPLFESLALLGKEESLARIEACKPLASP